MTYSTDPSFFTNIHIPFSDRNWLTTMNWFEKDKNSRFRLIRDDEADADLINLQMMDDLYPGTKTFSIVMNPFARAVVTFQALTTLDEIPDLGPEVDLSTFESFLKTVDKAPNTHWYSIFTQQHEWIEYTDAEGNLRKVDYVLHDETLEEDFKVIQEFFESPEPLVDIKPPVDYRSYYNEETKKFISEVCAGDLAYFGYSF
jgi:hypothetical protein